jgi:hypothetical protein
MFDLIAYFGTMGGFGSLPMTLDIINVRFWRKGNVRSFGYLHRRLASGAGRFGRLHLPPSAEAGFEAVAQNAEV